MMAQPMKLYFVRHGESEANVTREFSNHNPPKHPLTAKGRAQVEALAERLAGLPLTAIYASPLLRAQQTAEILAAPHGLTVQNADALREHDAGELEGRSDAEAWAQYAGLFDRWLAKELDARVAGGESYAELRDRFVPFLQELMQKYGGSEAHVVLVGHGGLFHTMLPLVLANVEPKLSFQHLLGNATVVLAETRSEQLICLTWGDIRFEQQTP